MHDAGYAPVGDEKDVFVPHGVLELVEEGIDTIRAVEIPFPARVAAEVLFLLLHVDRFIAAQPLEIPEILLEDALVLDTPDVSPF